MTFHITMTPGRVYVGFSAGSLKEAVSIMQQDGETAALETLYAMAPGGPAVTLDAPDGIPVDAQPIPGAPTNTETAGTNADGSPKKKGGRPSNAEKAAKAAALAAQQAAATAPQPVVNAPPPVPVPGAPLPEAPKGDHGIPDGLVRAEQLKAAAEAAAVAPPPPPPPVVAPPVSPLAEKFIAALESRRNGTPDGDHALINWLSACGIAQAGASWSEAMNAVRMTGHDRLAPIATSIGVQ